MNKMRILKYFEDQDKKEAIRLDIFIKKERDEIKKHAEECGTSNFLMFENEEYRDLTGYRNYAAETKTHYICNLCGFRIQ